MGTERLPATQEADAEMASGSPLGRAPVPGLLLVFSGGEPRCTPVPLGGEPVLLGRGLGPFAAVNDVMLSRSHARAAWADGRFEITDLGGRNGSALDGEPLQGTRVTSGGRVLRLGHSLFLLCADLSSFQQLGVQVRERRVGGRAHLSSTSSYSLGADGLLTTVSGAVPTTRTAACWLVVASSYAYVANAQTNDITGFAVAEGGALSLLDADGVTGQTTMGATDEDVTDDNEFLYVVNNGAHVFSIFQINADGSLTKKPDFVGIPTAVSGIVAR